MTGYQRSLSWLDMGRSLVMARRDHRDCSAGGLLRRRVYIGEPDQGGGSIAGQVQIAPNLADQVKPTDVLFVIVRRPTGPQGQSRPKRFDGPKFPVQFEITNEDVMVKGGELKGMVDDRAPRSRRPGGQPQPGDMEGRYAKNPTCPAGAISRLRSISVY